MKNITKIMMSAVVVVALASCGAMPRTGKAIDKPGDVSDAVLGSVDPKNVDMYTWWSHTTIDDRLPALIADQFLNQPYNINIYGLGIKPKVGAKFIGVSIVVDRTTGACGMRVRFGMDDDSDGKYDALDYIYGTSNPASQTIFCTAQAADGASTAEIVIIKSGTTNKYTATITDSVYKQYGGPFMSGMNIFDLNTPSAD